MFKIKDLRKSSNIVKSNATIFFVDACIVVFLDF